MARATHDDCTFLGLQEPSVLTGLSKAQSAHKDVPVILVLLRFHSPVTETSNIPRF